MKVEPVKLEARRLITIGPDHVLWDHGIAEFGDMRGAIVRVQPPANVTTDFVDSVRVQCVRNGAAVVRIDPRARAAVAPLVALGNWAKPNAVHAQREVVMALAEASPRAEELKQLLDVVLAKRGI